MPTERLNFSKNPPRITGYQNRPTHYVSLYKIATVPSIGKRHLQDVILMRMTSGGGAIKGGSEIIKAWRNRKSGQHCTDALAEAQALRKELDAAHIERKAATPGG